MKCAIQLVFSDKNQATINNLRETLVANGVHDEAVPINHITLADIDIKNNQLDLVKKILEEFSKNHKSLKIVFNSSESFADKK